MQAQILTSDLLVDLSKEQQQLLSGGRKDDDRHNDHNYGDEYER
ncbi:hypothetical protein WKK05_38505 (plasmid) [Nostoc sp. UHCC 0302]